MKTPDTLKINAYDADYFLKLIKRDDNIGEHYTLIFCLEKFLSDPMRPLLEGEKELMK